MSAKDILEAVTVTAELTGTQLSATAMAVMVQDLAAYPEPAVLQALTRCRRELTGRLTLAAVLERIQDADSRPGADEAWAIALASSDEAETVIWTEEIAQAFGIASPILAAGDKIGARMAFRDAYDRLVLQARSGGAPCVWSVSLGTDAERRATAITAAVDAGRIPVEKANCYLPAPKASGLIAAVLSGDQQALLGYASSGPSAARGFAMVRAQIGRLSDQAQRREAEQAQQRLAEQVELRSRKEAALADIARLRDERGESVEDPREAAGQ